MKKYDAIFLDRDGTINLDPGYINSLDDFEFYEYTFEALKNLKKITDRFCIITNQSGVARGLIDPDNLSKIHDHILNEFFYHDLNLIGIYYCTDHPESPTSNRKPGIGMYNKAAMDHKIDLKKSVSAFEVIFQTEKYLYLSNGFESRTSVFRKAGFKNN